MRAHRIGSLGLSIAALLLGARTSQAQTTATGPYYATPSWDQTLACTTSANCPRFVVLANFDNNAVLDRETGLVWERSPSESLAAPIFDQCGDLTTGHRFGWRLPTYTELRSLLDASQSSPALPPGHPFVNLHFFVPVPGGGGLVDLYWTSTPEPRSPPGFLKLVALGAPSGGGAAPPDATAFGRIWCVRGN
jgi:hypothetical protein